MSQLNPLYRILNVVLVLFLVLCSAVQAEQEQTEKKQEKISFDTYVSQLQEEALTLGIEQDTLDRAFAEMTFYERAVTADKNQPEFKLTLDTYLPKAVPEWKAKQAIALYREHRELLEEVGKTYGVQPRFIVALWGVETNFGRYTGNFKVVSALATMAYEGRREAFFKKQLWQALEIIQAGHISPEQMIGSWAGAMGQTQFMPSSFLAYAVDYDGDGKIDIWNSLPDVFASAANYLASVGWDQDQTWGRQVLIPDGFDVSLAKRDNKLTLAQWQELGVRRYDGSDLPVRDLVAGLVLPDGIEGRAYLTYKNWDVLMDWNRSNYFVAVVGYLSERIQMGQ